MRTCTVICILMAAALLAAAADNGPRNVAAPRLDNWTVLGPGGGGAMFLPTVSPHDPRDVLVRCDMTGAYVSHDSGDSWRMFNLRGVVRFFAFDPIDPKVIYAQTVGLWRSRDSARTWELVVPDAASVERIDRIGDHASDRLVTKDGIDRRVDALAIDPADSKTLYAAIAGAGKASLHVSTDWGRSWTKSADLPAGARRIWVDPRSPRRDRILYVAGRNSVDVRRGGVWVKQAAPEGVGQFADISAGFSPQGGALVVYGISGAGIHVSKDGGASWRKTGLASSARLVAVATALHRPDTAYVSYSGLEERELLSTRRFFGVAKTTDTGQSWTPVWKEADRPAPNIKDVWITEAFGPGWGENPINLGVAPNNPDICYGTDYGRTMRTTDGGRTWHGVYSKKSGEGYTSTGLDVTTCYGVHFDPFDRKRVFISYTDIGLSRSEDGGSSWTTSIAGVPRPWINTTYWVEFDPEVKGRAWAVMSGIHDLPRPKMWRRAPVSGFNGGVVVSDDGGRTWRVSGSGLPATAATHILLDPKSPAQARTLYVAGFGRGVFKSTDGGKNWTLKNTGIAGAEPFAWRLIRDAAGALYLVVARRSDDGGIGNASDGALYRSIDGAERWTRLALPEGVNGPNGLAIDPKDSKRMYLAAWGRAVDPADTGGGIYLSADAGASWKPAFTRDQHVYDVTIDPRNPNVLYACGFSSSAWRSADRGATWNPIRGYDFKWGHRVIPDPFDPERIYITTFGGSVWHGPAHVERGPSQWLRE